MKKNGKYIGTNHTNFAMMGGIDSSFSEAFTNEEVLVDSGFDYVPCIIGDIDEVYLTLGKVISEKQPQSFYDMCACLFAVIHDYFGDYSNISERMDNYPDLDMIIDGAEIGKVSSLKGKNCAMCVERAMLAQNLLNFLGFKSFYKSSGIINGDKHEVHAYNLVEFKDRYYVFDATMPSLINNEINPLICEIPLDVYEEITSPKQSVGYSVEVSYYNPLKSEDKHVIYDSSRKESINVDSLADVKVYT